MIWYLLEVILSKKINRNGACGFGVEGITSQSGPSRLDV